MNVDGHLAWLMCWFIFSSAKLARSSRQRMLKMDLQNYWFVRTFLLALDCPRAQHGRHFLCVACMCYATVALVSVDEGDCKSNFAWKFPQKSPFYPLICYANMFLRKNIISSSSGDSRSIYTLDTHLWRELDLFLLICRKTERANTSAKRTERQGNDSIAK